jgi:hypothetical protein
MCCHKGGLFNLAGILYVYQMAAVERIFKGWTRLRVNCD